MSSDPSPVVGVPPVARHSAVRGVAIVLLVLGALAGCGDNSATTQSRPVKQSKEEKLGTPNTTVPASRPAPSQHENAKPVRARSETGGAVRPRVQSWPIPFSSVRRRETAEYARRHYGTPTTHLEPKVIVEHYSVTSTAQAVFDTFAPDAPDVELHELPGLCSHFVVDRDGTIFQLVPLSLICRHTVGLNDVAIGIEHVGSSDADVLGNPRQLAASLRLTAWLRCRYGIAVENVIGHAESLSSPYHHENVPALRNQTHSDFQPEAMNRYRDQLRKRRC